MRGEKLTTTVALIKYQIGDLRRRIKDLKDNWDIPIQSEYAKDIKGNKTRFKQHFINKTELILQN